MTLPSSKDIADQTYFVCCSAKIIGVLVGVGVLLYLRKQKQIALKGDPFAPGSLILPVYEPIVIALLTVMSMEICILTWGEFKGTLFNPSFHQLTAWALYELSRDGFVMVFIQSSLSKAALFRTLGLALVWPIFGVICGLLVLHTEIDWYGPMLFHAVPCLFNGLVALPSANELEQSAHMTKYHALIAQSLPAWLPSWPRWLKSPFGSWRREPIRLYCLWMSIYRGCWVMYYFIRSGPYISWWYYPNLLIAGFMELPLTFMWYSTLREDTDFWHWGGLLGAAKGDHSSEFLVDDDSMEAEDDSAEADAEVQVRYGEGQLTCGGKRIGRSTENWDGIDAVLQTTSKLLSTFSSLQQLNDGEVGMSSSPEKLTKDDVKNGKGENILEEELYDALLFGVSPSLPKASKGSEPSTLRKSLKFLQNLVWGDFPRTSSSISSFQALIGSNSSFIQRSSPSTQGPSGSSKLVSESLSSKVSSQISSLTPSLASSFSNQSPVSSFSFLSSSSSHGQPTDAKFGLNRSKSADEAGSIDPLSLYSDLAEAVKALDALRGGKTLQISPNTSTLTSESSNLMVETGIVSFTQDNGMRTFQLPLNSTDSPTNFAFYTAPDLQPVLSHGKNILDQVGELPLLTVRIDTGQVVGETRSETQYSADSFGDGFEGDTKKLEKPGTEPHLANQKQYSMSTKGISTSNPKQTRRKPNTGDVRSRSNEVLPENNSYEMLPQSNDSFNQSHSSVTESGSGSLTPSDEKRKMKVYRSNVLQRLELGLLSDAPDAVVQEGIQLMIEANRRHLVHFGHIAVLEDEEGKEILLGAGTFSRVFLGAYKRKVKVALKFFVKLLDLDKDTVAAFARETAVHSQLRHPSIVRCYGLCVCPPALILVTEFCSRGALWDCLESQRSRITSLTQVADKLRSSLIRRQSDLHSILEHCLKTNTRPQIVLPTSKSSIKESNLFDLVPTSRLFEMGGTWSFIMRLRLALSAARGLEFLHSRGLLHRDVKSPNYLVSRRWRSKVSDFGLTRKLANLPKVEDTESESSLIQEVPIHNPKSQSALNSGNGPMTAGVGTYMWMAPEVLAQQIEYGYESDIFSLGGVLAELFTTADFSGERIDALTVCAAFESQTEAQKRAASEISSIIDTYERNAELFDHIQSSTAKCNDSWEAIDRATAEGVDLLIRLECGVRPAVPQFLQDFILKCLDDDKNRRPTAKEIVQVLFEMYVQALLQ